MYVSGIFENLTWHFLLNCFTQKDKAIFIMLVFCIIVGTPLANLLQYSILFPYMMYQSLSKGGNEFHIYKQ